MRKLYNEFFYIPKYGKIREKVMLARVAMTVVIMVVCLAAMSITAYAYFSHNVTSGSNIIKSASFYTDVTVQITAEDGTVVETITTNTSDHKSHSAELSANKTYTITVKHNDRSTAQTGFVIVTADGCETRYHTQQLGRDGNGNTYTITFKLTPGANTIVTFRSHWGTSSFYSDFKEIGENDERYIIDGEEIKLIVGGVAPSAENGASGETEPAGETTTTPTTDTSTGTESSDTTSTATESTETSEPTDSTTEPSTSTVTEPTTVTEPATTEPATTEPATTEPATTDTTVTTESTETQPAEEITGAPTTEANE